MRILYFSSRECWPPNTGARLRDYYLATELARRAELTYVGLRNPRDPPAVDPPAEAGFKQSVLIEKEPEFTAFKLLRGIVGRVPVTVLNCWSTRVAAQLGRM